MREPDATEALLEIWEQAVFYAYDAGSTYDWYQFYPRLVEAIRQEGPGTPILVGGLGWSAVRGLPYLKPPTDVRTVHVAHQYEPQVQYTHQAPWGDNTYPGSFDLDWDGELDRFDRHWLDRYLAIIGAYEAGHGAPSR